MKMNVDFMIFTIAVDVVCSCSCCGGFVFVCVCVGNRMRNRKLPKKQRKRGGRMKERGFMILNIDPGTNLISPPRSFPFGLWDLWNGEEHGIEVLKIQVARLATYPCPHRQTMRTGKKKVSKRADKARETVGVHFVSQPSPMSRQRHTSRKDAFR